MITLRFQAPWPSPSWSLFPPCRPLPHSRGGRAGADAGSEKPSWKGKLSFQGD